MHSHEIDQQEQTTPKTTAQPVTLKELSRQSVKKLNLTEKWRGFIGSVPKARPWSALVTGAPGAGKSTIMLQLASELSRHGDVLFFCAEEVFDSGTIKERANLLGISSSKIWLIESQDIGALRELVETGKYAFVIVDSINRMKRQEEKLEAVEVVDDLLRLQKSVKCSLIFIAQMEKQRRTYAGAGSIGHDVDIEWVCKNIDGDRVIQNIKNRFTPSQNELVIFNRTNKSDKQSAGIMLQRERARRAKTRKLKARKL